jgi:hypothetical protein
MRTVTEIESEIATLQAELEASRAEPDLSEAVEAWKDAYLEDVGLWENGIRAGLLAAFPAMQRAMSQPEPTEAEDLAMARKLTDDWWATSIVDVAPAINLALAAMLAERARAKGGSNG